ncbi:hypothetical protein [Devosia marina]|uniref:Uncharacterized protein n=1 Tax=Devosia marina TaxID=2683198 RepID=A0A7X3FR51_9HYPH|nr:hypothetical protein [Devosia marina]MVS99252.1 hypothetical protein [Devosia marina]
MTSALRTRLDRIEKLGGDAMQRYIASLSEEELEARCEELSARLRGELEANGHDCTGLDNNQLVALAQSIDPTWPKAGAR